jgi:AcrR family transcriptional regulator
MIAANFKQLALKKPLYKINVRDIIDVCDINKNTFYYHFVDRDDLVIWVFRNELANLLRGSRFAELISDTALKNDRYRDLPFYVNMRNPEDDLNLASFWTLFGNYLYDNEAYYFNILRARGNSNLPKYIFSIYTWQFELDIRYLLGARRMAEQDVKFLAGYFCHGCLGWTLSGIRRHSPQVVWPDGGYKNITHDIMRLIVSNAP